MYLDVVSVVSLIVSVLSSITSLVIVYLNYRKEMSFYKLNSYKERLNNVYVPFYRAYCTGRLFSNQLTDFDEDTIERFINLFNDNIHYLDTASQAMYCNVYFNYVQWTTYNSMGLYENTRLYEDSLNSSFATLAQLLLLQYQKLLKVCCLPESITLPSNQRHE